MNAWSDVFYIAIISVALLLSAIGLWFTAAMPGFDRWNKRFFRDYYIAIIACCVSVIAGHFFYLYRFPVSTVFLVLILDSLLPSLPMLMLTVYLLHSASEEIRESRLLKAVLGILHSASAGGRRCVTPAATLRWVSGHP